MGDDPTGVPLRQVKTIVDLPWSAQQGMLCMAAMPGSHEKCGFILRSGAIIQVKNVAPWPSKSFELDPSDQLWMMKNYANHILGIFHTHPGGVARPSTRDHIGWPENLQWRYFIVTTKEITEWARKPSDISNRARTSR